MSSGWQQPLLGNVIARMWNAHLACLLLEGVPFGSCMQRREGHACPTAVVSRLIASQSKSSNKLPLLGADAA